MAALVKLGTEIQENNRSHESKSVLWLCILQVGCKDMQHGLGLPSSQVNLYQYQLIHQTKHWLYFFFFFFFSFFKTEILIISMSKSVFQENIKKKFLICCLLKTAPSMPSINLFLPSIIHEGLWKTGTDQTPKNVSSDQCRHWCDDITNLP